MHTNLLRAGKNRINPLEMFRSEKFDPEYTKKYSAWDHEGIPIKDTKGDPIPKNQDKKLRKLYATQKKLYEASKPQQS